MEERQLAGELRAEDMLINLPDEIDLENNTSETVNISNMNDVLQFLENDGDSNIVIIKLPESKSFNRYGEPRLLNASEHPRRMMER